MSQSKCVSCMCAIVLFFAFGIQAQDFSDEKSSKFERYEEGVKELDFCETFTLMMTSGKTRVYLISTGIMRFLIFDSMDQMYGKQIYISNSSQGTFFIGKAMAIKRHII